MQRCWVQRPILQKKISGGLQRVFLGKQGFKGREPGGVNRAEVPRCEASWDADLDCGLCETLPGE